MNAVTLQEQCNILLVDDEQRNLDTLESILDDPTYSLLRAADADKALKLLLENDVAAIVLDIKMPGVSGFELAQMIKGSKKFRQIPILFLTAYLVDEHDVAAGYGAGAVDYLTKPIDPFILRHKIGVFVELFRKTRALAELNETLERRVQERTADLERSEAALREANKQKDKFLATLAHELRNPLAPLRTGLDLLLRSPERSPSMGQALETMDRQVDHMVRLIDDLLDVSRISRGTLELRKESASLASVIERAVETSSPVLARRDQTVAVEAEERVVAAVDPTRIAQVVSNLLNNASKHSPRGARIRVALRRAAGKAIIDVVDPGAGIPPEQLDRIFQMFTKIERPNQAGNDGLGIGLALSRQVAELHGGSLAATSEGEGKGATFTLSVPIGVVEAPRPEPAAEEPQPKARRGLNVVIVEDNEDAAQMMQVWLSLEGHEAKVAHTGPDGVALISEAKPDVVLCDIGLPGMDGVDVCRTVLANDAPAKPVMVALTGWGADADRTRTVEVGFRHHLVKPVDLDKLRVLLEKIGAERAA